MACLIYPKANTEDVYEACQPIAGWEGIGPCLLGTPVESTDGRCAHVHGWSEIEVEFITARCEGIAQVLDELPADWEGVSEW